MKENAKEEKDAAKENVADAKAKRAEKKAEKAEAKAAAASAREEVSLAFGLGASPPRSRAARGPMSLRRRPHRGAAPPASRRRRAPRRAAPSCRATPSAISSRVYGASNSR